MDALDEFFAIWCEPEAWCEMCGDYPAIHVVLYDTTGKYGGVMSHVRVRNPAVQRQVPVCRQCCQDQMQLLDQSMQCAQTRDHLRPGPLASFRRIGQCWSHGLRQLLRHGRRVVPPLFLSRRRSR